MTLAIPSSPTLSPRTVPFPDLEADLNYLTPIAEKPHSYICEPPAGVARQNFSHEPHRFAIANGRSLTSDLSLEQQGFSFHVHPSVVRNFHDENAIRQIYYPEAENWFKL